MPEEVFTLENQRALAKICEFVPTAAKIHAVMGDQATRAVRTRMALRSLAELPSPALPPPAPLSDEERAASQAEVSRLVASFKTSLVGRPVYGVRPSGVDCPPALREVHAKPEALAALRANNPLVRAALAQAATEKG